MKTRIKNTNLKLSFTLGMLLLTGASPAFAQDLFFTTDYTSLPVPQQYFGTISYVNDEKQNEIKDIDEIILDKTLLNSLSDIVSSVTVYEIKNDGDLKVVGVGLSAKNTNYQIIYDFTQSQTVTWEDNNDTKISNSAIVGVGVRMVAKVKTLKAGINLSSPFSLTANREKIEGSLEIRVIGISSQKINGIIPTTTDLSHSSLSICLQAVATIKSHLYDDETIIVPKYLAYKSTNVKEEKNFEKNEKKSTVSRNFNFNKS